MSTQLWLIISHSTYFVFGIFAGGGGGLGILAYLLVNANWSQGYKHFYQRKNSNELFRKNPPRTPKIKRNALITICFLF